MTKTERIVTLFRYGRSRLFISRRLGIPIPEIDAALRRALNDAAKSESRR